MIEPMESYAYLCTEDGHLSYCPHCRCMDYKEVFYACSTDYYRLCSECHSILGAGIIKYLEGTLTEVRQKRGRE